MKDFERKQKLLNRAINYIETAANIEMENESINGDPFDTEESEKSYLDGDALFFALEILKKELKKVGK